MNIFKILGEIFFIVSLSTHCQCSGEGESRDRYLSLPKLEKCNSRFMESQYKNRNFFYSGNDPELKDKRLDWLDSRNTCRDRCMETVSFEDQEKFDFFKSYIEKQNISFIWTSGRLCDFDGCEGRWDLLPKRIKGWLWSANQIPIAPTNKTPPGWKYQPWSFTGLKKKPQPDNAEFYLSQTSESCLGILNNMYNDSVAWHDIACYHRARFICEDSELLLREVHETTEASANIDVETSTTTISVTTTTQPTSPKTNENLAVVRDSSKIRRKVLEKKQNFAANEDDKKSSASDGNSNETTSAKPALAVEMEKDVAEKVTIGGSSVDGNVEEEETTTFAPETSSTTTTTKRTSRVRGGGRRRSQ